MINCSAKNTREIWKNQENQEMRKLSHMLKGNFVLIRSQKLWSPMYATVML